MAQVLHWHLQNHLGGFGPVAGKQYLTGVDILVHFDLHIAYAQFERGLEFGVGKVIFNLRAFG